MLGGSLFLLIDDIATVLDDIAILTKIATKKTAGVLGDDLALNAAQVSGMTSERELPVIWAVAKGSLINKAILVPCALLIAAFAPSLILPLLAIGGLYLCFEGVEKLWHTLHNRLTNKPQIKDKSDEEKIKEISAKNITHKDIKDLEKTKIRGAIRTDFILSAEIIVISLGTVANANILTKAGVLVAIAIFITAAVYGLVAGIVKVDDLGVYFCKQKQKLLNKLGNALLWFAPWLMRSLSFFGTLAMFLVGGGIISHSFHLAVEISWLPQWLVAPLANLVIGLMAGTVTLILFESIRAVYKKFKKL